jgi:ribosome maturation factor RimP
MRESPLARDLESRVEELGFELVELEQAGNQHRPILRLRIDRPDAAPGSSVTLDDCTRVSRALEQYLDERPDLSTRYVLEVSSPGVERPLVRRRDWERFAGHEVALRGKRSLADRGTRVEGVLLGLVSATEEDAGTDRIALRLPDGEEVEIPCSEISHANLIYRWGGKTGSR